MKMTKNATISPRVIGLDCHPDSFTAAMLQGSTPAQAIVQRVYNKVPLSRLCSWAQKTLGSEDLVILEASGNSFETVRALKAIDRKAVVLESCQLGRLKDAHANNDKISAVRIGKAYLAGTAKEVWVPDLLTQERRDCFHAYQKATKRCTQLTNRLLSYLSDYGVRLPQGLPAQEKREQLLSQAKAWSARQWQIVQGLLLELDHAQQQAQHWSSLMAQEVLEDPLMLSLIRLCGVRDIVAFALGAIIGNIHRFAEPAKLVAYVGLNPAFDDSGQGQWQGGIGGHGRKDLRSLLIQSAQAIIRTDHPLSRWAKTLMARKGSKKLAVAAVARRLTVAIWYLMMGRWTALDEVDDRLSQKVGKVITKAGQRLLQKTDRQKLRQQAIQSLKRGRTYVLDPEKRWQDPPPQYTDKKTAVAT
jgi:transposase